VSSDPGFSDWQSFLAARGARIAGGVVGDFGDPAAERAAAAGGSIAADLAQYGVLEAGGADARAFLHGQLSCDVEGLGDGAAARGAYCTAKGRVLANFLLWSDAGAFRLLLPRALVPAIRKRLQPYVLRSKVAFEDRSEALVVLGLAGPAASSAAAAAIGVEPAAELAVVRGEAAAAIALGGGRLLAVTPVARAPQLWNRLAAALTPVGAPCWDWLEIASGHPWITVPTQDQFVPQMANLELLGGVSFRKGCYPGQEIVARMQYLGTPRRRLHLAHVEADFFPAPGAVLVADGAGEQSAGTVVNAAPAPGSGYDLLAVVQTAAAAARVRLGSADGPVLRFRPLPYAVPGE
jgi:hypothetical protein